MTDITSACLLAHRRLLQCRRGTLGVSISDKLSQGSNTKCLEIKMKIVDNLLGVLCRYDPDATLNCLTSAKIDKIITHCYKLLPKDC
jgi:hypothetical protein